MAGTAPCQSRAINGRLEPVELADRALIADGARIESGLRLEQQDVGLLGSDGQVVDPMRHVHELAFIHPHVAVAELDKEPAFHDEKQLVLYVMVMPHELALDLDELHVGVVDLAHDLRAPMVVELPELLGEVHATHARRPPDALVPPFPSGCPPVRLSVRSCGKAGSIRRRQGSSGSPRRRTGSSRCGAVCCTPSRATTRRSRT